MRLLLDTRAFLWWVDEDALLSSRARRTIADARNDVFFSVASGWEIVTKEATGRLRLAEPARQLIPEQLEANGFLVLPLLLEHALRAGGLPGHHRDPFDRLLVAQAMVEGLSLVTADDQVRRYPVRTIW